MSIFPLEGLKNFTADALLEYLKGSVPDVISLVLKVLFALLVYFVGVRLIRWIRKLIRSSMTRAKVDTGVVQFVEALVKVIAYVLLFILIISFFGVQTTSLIAVFGSAGLAVGLALQGSLSNFAGGVLILVLKPFVVGDYIIEGSYEGKVTEISLFMTELLTVDNRAVLIPNGDLANSPVINVTHEDKRRLDLSVGISYQADLKKAKDILQSLMEKDPDVMQDQPIRVFVDSLGDSAVQLGARAWVGTDRYWDTKWRLTEQIKLEFDAANVEIPFNQMDVHIRQ